MPLTHCSNKGYICRMKKWIIPVLLFVAVSLNAQTKITKNGITGKWALLAVEMPGMVYYHIDKDSVALGELVKKMTPADQLAATTALLKQQLAAYTKMYFTYNPDGTAQLQTSDKNVAGASSTKFTVDEVNSTITTIENGQPGLTVKAEMLNGNLVLSSPQPQGQIIMTLKRLK